MVTCCVMRGRSTFVMDSDRYFTLASLISYCEREIVQSDAQMQLAQRDAWRGMNNGFPTFEGVDHFEFLGVSTVALKFHLEPVVPWWWRLLAAIRIPFLPKKKWNKFKLSRKKSALNGAIDCSITIQRKKNGSFQTECNTDPEKLVSP